MTAQDRSTRERLLEAAARLTYEKGFGVGIAELCSAAGVSKRSMYQMFESKDELLAASLRWGAAAYVADLLPRSDDEMTPRDRILHVFDRLELQASRPSFFGCQYLGAQIELKDPEHPARRVAGDVKQQLTDFIRDEASRGGAEDPDLVARQLSIVFDGASARAGVRADVLTGLVRPTVSALLDAAGVD
ncbi:TetR/AcrR family transcriptional regulator [Microbacterium karelineae]|uniref:TetR/AcrR family transcriptional regulator n=1 Tax=Microbacterium karelineae TaxID=2654283 RepID=UPI0012E9EA1B|nr:TetR/AcrR family transcriptional regulator [Microbacterium karelineae]